MLDVAQIGNGVHRQCLDALGSYLKDARGETVGCRCPSTRLSTGRLTRDRVDPLDSHEQGTAVSLYDHDVMRSIGFVP